MKSMTGYGCSSASFEDGELSIEVSSINRRSLEIITSLPKDWQMLDQDIGTHIRKSLVRGKVNVFVKYETGYGRVLSIDEEAMERSLSSLQAVSEKFNCNFDVTTEVLLRLALNAETGKKSPEKVKVKEILFETLDKALKSLIEMRTHEGILLLKDMNERMDVLSNLLAAIEEMSGEVVEQYRAQMFKRLNDAGLQLSLDDDRVLKEIALFADRSDITEEIVRLKSHFNQFIEAINTEEAIGRKLDFICQEILREFNTIGSKANYIGITQKVIDAKNEIEKIREQVQNIE